jgi:hypothetical protein
MIDRIAEAKVIFTREIDIATHRGLLTRTKSNDDDGENEGGKLVERSDETRRAMRYRRMTSDYTTSFTLLTSQTVAQHLRVQFKLVASKSFKL